MNEYVWVKNPKGREVEVERKHLHELLKAGYVVLDTPISRLQKIDLDAIIPQGQYPYGGYGRVIELLEHRIRFHSESKNKIYLGYPREIERKEREKLFLITAFEANKLPHGWIEKCNHFDVIIVPSQWCRNLFLDAGVKRPVEIMVQGTDNFDIFPKEFSHPFRFLHYNSFSDDKRKGWDLAVSAFLHVFGRYDKVELVLKGRTHDNEADIKSVSRRSNIRIIVKNMNRRDIEQLQEDCHCMVFPSRGEGIGLPPIETMARGIPTIVTDATGMTEYAYLAEGLHLTTPVSSSYRGFSWDGEVGQWIEPDTQELEERMFYIYRNYDKVKAAAIANAPKIKERFNLDVMAQTFITIIHKYA